VTVGRIPDEDIARVREASDLMAVVQETVVLRQRGRLWWGVCPFHSEKTPSFKIDPATQLWYCFGCSEGGDVIRYVMRRDTLEFTEAVHMLAERSNIEIREEGGHGPAKSEKDRLMAACEAATDFFHKRLMAGRDPGATAARDYLGGRGFGSETARRFRLGYAPSGRDLLVHALADAGFTDAELVGANLAVRDDRGTLKDRFFNRVMFPIEDLTGHVIAFGGRVVGEGHPKYLNSQETPIFHKSANLYGLSRARAEMARSGTAVVVEGYTDVIALQEAGVGTAVATLGTALTSRHVKLLARFAKRVVYLFDGDEAGQRAAQRAGEFLDLQATPEAAEGRIDFRVAVVPEGMDPADYASANGTAGMHELIDRAEPLLRFLIDRRLEGGDLATPEGRSAALRTVGPVLAGLRGSILAHDYMQYVADRLLVDYATIDRAVSDSRAEVVIGGGDETPGDDRLAVRRPATRMDAERQLELEILGMAVRCPSVRPEARELLQLGLVSDPDRAALLAAVADANDAKGAELISVLESKIPGAAEILSEAPIDEREGEPIDSQFSQLAGRLREIGMKRRITALQARLRALDPQRDREEYDLAFTQAAELQKQLERERT
jgi:DNA primase